jgi:glutathione S-transferase
MPIKDPTMLTLYSYPGLFGLSDNNPYGLKVATFLRLCHVPFRHEHVMDASKAPRGQLPYIDDDGVTVGDSSTILAYVTGKLRLGIDTRLVSAQKDLAHLVNRALDDLYWVMSYSRWRDPRFWPLFRDAMLKACPGLNANDLAAAQNYNFERYRHQGIGRFEPEEVYERGLADLQVLTHLIGEKGSLFDDGLHGVDAAIFGFLANIFYFPIDTPLKLLVQSEPGLVVHCKRVRAVTEQ